MLKKIRFGLAVVVGCLIAFYFLDFTGLTTGWPNLARIHSRIAGGECRCCNCVVIVNPVVWASLLFCHLSDGNFSGFGGPDV